MAGEPERTGTYVGSVRSPARGAIENNLYFTLLREIERANLGSTP